MATRPPAAATVNSGVTLVSAITMRPWLLLLLSLFTLAVTAQSNSAKPATSTVTGHVYCADTNAPARMASVMLEPVRIVDEAGIVTSGSHSQIMMTAVQTGLDGSFMIPKVSPGAYYVIAYKAGISLTARDLPVGRARSSLRKRSQAHRRYSSENHHRGWPARIHRSTLGTRRSPQRRHPV